MKFGALSAAMIDRMIPLDGIMTVSYDSDVRENSGLASCRSVRPPYFPHDEATPAQNGKAARI